MLLRTAISVVVVVVAQLFLSSVNSLDPHLSSNPAILRETNTTIPKDTNPGIHKETNPAIHIETNPATLKETNPAIPKGTNPAIHKETNLATPQETNLAIPKETNPAIPKETNLATPQETNPAIHKETNLAIYKETNPMTPTETNPAISLETNPSIPKDTNPAIPEKTNPAIPKETDQTIPKETNPATPIEKNPAIHKEKNPANPKEKDPAIPKETIVTGSNGKYRKKYKSPEDNEYRIAWLAPEKEYHNFSAATSVGAMKLALYRIQKGVLNHDLKEGTLRAKWYDTNCDSKQALLAFVQSIEDFDPDVIIGPPCSTGLRCVAQLASIWNLPIFSWVSDLIDFKDADKYTTLVRLSGPLYSTFEILRQTSIYFKWQNYAIIYDKAAPYEAVALALRERAGTDTNYTIRSVQYVTNETKDSDIKDWMQQITKYSRVIIFVVPWHMLRHYLLIAHSLGMANGEFAFICINGDMDRSNPHICRYCGNVLKSKSSLRQHEISHTGTGKGYTCCDKVFFSKANRNRHRCHVHGEEKAFVCIKCSKSFPTNADLQKHMRRENGQTIACDNCGVRFAEKSNLKAHMDMHNEEHNLKCLKCDKVFRHRSSLSRHIKVHSSN